VARVGIPPVCLRDLLESNDLLGICAPSGVRIPTVRVCLLRLLDSLAAVPLAIYRVVSQLCELAAFLLILSH
jgi:hypothetical protein